MRTVVAALALVAGAVAIIAQPNADAAISSADQLDWHIAGAGPDISRLARPLGQIAIASQEIGTLSNRFESEVDALAKWRVAPDIFANLQTAGHEADQSNPFGVSPQVSKREDVPLPRSRPQPQSLVSIDPREFGGGPRIIHIALGQPVLAPLAHVHFCQVYPEDCRVQKVASRDELVDLTPERLEELKAVNASVNRAIHPQNMHEAVADEKWLILPKYGDCNDYAVSKRHELLERGWSARSLLLAEVVTSWGEHHLVLIIRTNQGDLVADNLYPKIRAWSAAPYEWVRIQSPENPTFWASMRRIPSA